MLLLKLLLTPLLTLAVSLAARAWGHRASGWLTSLPLVAAPIAAVLLVEQGTDFLVKTAVATLVSLPAIAAYILVFARVARTRGWVASLLSGWAVFMVCAIPLSFVPVGPWVGLAMTWVALAAAYRLLPRSNSPRVPVHVPRVEIAFRMAASVALMLVISYGAEAFGPQVSGALMAFPIGGSVLPAFTRALHGVEATSMLMRGFTLGMFGFPLFLFGLAVLLGHVHPVAAFAGGLLGVLAGHFAAAMAANRGWVR
jgi:hypothetical protein